MGSVNEDRVTTAGGKRSGRRLVSTLASLLLAAGALAAVPPAPAEAAVPAGFTLDGAGWGHGVGMSQYGAQGQALSGRSYRQILEHYYNPASVTSTADYATSNIKVQLLHAQSTTVTPGNGKMQVRVGGNHTTTAESVTFRLDGNEVVVSGGVSGRGSTVGILWQNTRFWPGGGGDTTVSVSGADGGRTGTYRHGSLRIDPLNGKLNAVNTLRLNDEYLYGLAEMPSSWQIPALAAQAVAGRTYAMRNMGSLKSDCGCNVYDEVRSQKFSGWSKENEGGGAYGDRWKGAVDATLSMTNNTPTSARVLHYGGRLIDAVYFSSSGGYTRNSEDVWTAQVPYLRSRPDPWSLHSRNPNSAWTQTVSQAKAASAFGLADVEHLSMVYGDDDAVSAVTAISSGGATRTLTKDTARWALGLKSAWFGTPPSFSDTSGTTFERHIEWLAAEGITGGYADGTFRPTRYVARYETATFLYRYSDPNFPEPTEDVFSDVPAGHSYAQEIGWAADRRITGGRADGSFGPQALTTRAQMAAFLFAYVQNVCGRDGSYTPPASSPFSDVNAGGAFYEPISWLAQSGITGGFGDGTFRPSKTTTRGEMAAFMYRLNTYTGGSC